MAFRDLLIDAGYILSNDGVKYWRTQAIYRSGSNKSALRINKRTGAWSDFVSGKGGNFRQLMQLTLGRDIPDEELNKLIEEHEIEFDEGEAEEIKMEKTWDISELNKLMPNFSFYLKKGISKETLQDFHCGFAEGGAMSMRVVFPVFREDGKIIGWNGRATLPDKAEKMKWKKLGPSANFIYPCFMPSKTAKVRKVFPCLEAIKEKQEIIIIESIGDALALWEAGIKNILVTFGTKLSSKVCAFIASQGIKKVIIATNNDFVKAEEGEENTGERFAYDCFIQLASIMNYNKIVVHLPQGFNDFGDSIVNGDKEILDWYAATPKENSREIYEKILARMRERYKQRELSNSAVKLGVEIKEMIDVEN